MSDIVWEEPPPRKKGGKPNVWIPRLRTLMERPGEWARLPGDAGAGTKARQYAADIGGKWEFATRAVDDKRLLYARYVGPK